MAGVEEFEQHRRYLGAVAYRLLGSVADAEDAVQEAWLRWHAVDGAEVRNPRAFLTTVITRLCYDELGSARARREAYYGEWLPEPLLADELTPPDLAERGEEVSLAMMAVLERLSPAERAAFVLHDVFGVEFPQIAATLERTEAAVRQLASRARRQVKDSGPRRGVDPAAHRDAVRAFADAIGKGDLVGLMKVLDPEVVWHSDGGGVVRAGVRPVEGAQKVARLVLGIMERFWEPGTEIVFVEVNGEYGMALYRPDGSAIAVVGFTVAEGLITATHLVVNPDKLGHVSRAPRV